MTCRPLNVVTIVAALGIAHPALGQPGSPLPCNALCRAYMGPHYMAPDEQTAGPAETSAVAEPGDGPSVAPTPPRRPVEAGLPAPRRFAVLPPPRPETRNDVSVAGEPATLVSLPVTLPAVLDPTPAATVAPDPLIVAPFPVPAPEVPATIEAPVAEPIAVPAAPSPTVEVSAREAPTREVSVQQVPAQETLAQETLAREKPARSSAAPKPRREPERLGLFD